MGGKEGRERSITARFWQSDISLALYLFISFSTFSAGLFRSPFWFASIFFQPLDTPLSVSPNSFLHCQFTLNTHRQCSQLFGFPTRQRKVYSCAKLYWNTESFLNKLLFLFVSGLENVVTSVWTVADLQKEVQRLLLRSNCYNPHFYSNNRSLNKQRRVVVTNPQRIISCSYGACFPALK